MFRQLHRRCVISERLEPRTLLSLAFGATATTTDSQLVALPGAVQTADIDGDGKTDLIVGVNRSGSTLSLSGTDVLLSNGNGTFSIQDGPDFPAAFATSTNAFAVGALTTGGPADLIYATQQNNGSLTAQITPQINTSTAGTVSFTAASPTTIATPTSFNPQQVLIGDFSGDGTPDVAVLGLSPAGESLVILTGNGSGGFVESYSNTIVVNTGEQLTDGQLIPGDFNGDGKLDLAVYDPITGDVTFLINTSTAGSVSFSQTAAPISLAATGYDSGPVAAADFNQDGSTDLVVGENGTNGGADALVVFLASGTSSANLTLIQQPAVPAGNPADDQIGALAVGDFTSDGHVDVAEDYGVLLGDGAGNLSSPTAALNTSLLTNTQGFNALAVGNFDGSGKLGLAGVEQANHTILAANQTAPAPSNPIATTTTLSSNDNPADIGDTVTFTAAVSAASGSPTGYVTFFDGTTELASVAIASGSATFSDNSLQIGDASIAAKYLGNASFSASTSAALTESVLATLPSDSSLVPSIASARLPASVVAGARLNLIVPVALVNTAAATSTGRTSIALYANTVPALDGSQVTLASDTIRNLPIRASRAVLLHLRVLTLPATLPVGTYYLIATVTDSTGATSGAAAASTIKVAAPFTSVSASLQSLRVPPSVVGGQRTAAFALLKLTNIGNVNYVGPLTLSLFASTSQTVLAGATPFRTLLIRRTVLRPSIGVNVRLPLGTYPSVATQDDYYIIAQATDGAGNIGAAPSAGTLQIAPANLALSATISAASAAGNIAAIATVVLSNIGNVVAAGITRLTISSSSQNALTYASINVRISIPVGGQRSIKIPIRTTANLPGQVLVLSVVGPGDINVAVDSTPFQ